MPYPTSVALFDIDTTAGGNSEITTRFGCKRQRPVTLSEEISYVQAREKNPYKELKTTTAPTDLLMPYMARMRPPQMRLSMMGKTIPPVNVPFENTC